MMMDDNGLHLFTYEVKKKKILERIRILRLSIYSLYHLFLKPIICHSHAHSLSRSGTRNQRWPSSSSELIPDNWRGRSWLDDPCVWCEASKCKWIILTLQGCWMYKWAQQHRECNLPLEKTWPVDQAREKSAVPT